MKLLCYGALAVLATITCFTQAQSPEKQVAGPYSAMEKLIGAWHLAHIDAGQDRMGSLSTSLSRKGC
jgi:hypothetical protein